MEDIRRILVVSRSTKYCQRAVRYGVSLTQKYEAELYVLHVIHDPFHLEQWPIALPSLTTVEQEYRAIQEQARKDLDIMVETEKAKGMPIHVMVRDGDPNQEIFELVKDQRIDLLIMLAHEEGRLEHFLFGRGLEENIRKLPCHVMLVKKEPGAVIY